MGDFKSQAQPMMVRWNFGMPMARGQQLPGLFGT